jgi:hypothetical protein
VSLAAVTYESGFPIDTFMASVAALLRADGIKIAGLIQQNASDAPTTCAAMDLVDLSEGTRVRISQDLGPHAEGCRLDPRALVSVEDPLARKIRARPDIFILNKFGRAEAEGDGLRAIFARAIEAGIPVLTAVRPPHTEAWAAFHGGLAADLAPDLDAVLAWCRAQIVRMPSDISATAAS